MLMSADKNDVAMLFRNRTEAMEGSSIEDVFMSPSLKPNPHQMSTTYMCFLTKNFENSCMRFIYPYVHFRFLKCHCGFSVQEGNYQEVLNGWLVQDRLYHCSHTQNNGQ